MASLITLDTIERDPQKYDAPFECLAIVCIHAQTRTGTSACHVLAQDNSSLHAAVW